jgi:hypothetical protein
MSFVALLLAAQAAAVSTPLSMPPACRAAQLRLSVDGRDGDFNGMSHSGTALSIRNLGADCTLAKLPVIELRDARGRVLPAVRQSPPGMHPGPVMIPVRLGAGQRATMDLRWTSGPVFPANRSVIAATVALRIGHALVRSPLKAVLFGPAGKTVTFQQTPLQIAEGMAAG